MLSFLLDLIGLGSSKPKRRRFRSAARRAGGWVRSGARRVRSRAARGYGRARSAYYYARKRVPRRRRY